MTNRPIISLALIAAVSVAGCSAAPPPPPPAPDGSTCASACGNARALGCVEHLSAPGATCEAVCQNAEANGNDFKTRCISSAKSCPVLKMCGEPQLRVSCAMSWAAISCRSGLAGW